MAFGIWYSAFGIGNGKRTKVCHVIYVATFK